MSSFKFYKYAAWGLLLLNVILIASFILTKPKLHPRNSPHDFQAKIIKELDLNEQQATTFRALAQEHRQAINAINERQRTLIPPYFKSLVDTSIHVNDTSILSEFEILEREKLVVSRRHFQEIKNLLTQEQAPHFKGFMDGFIKKIVLNSKKPPHPPKD